MKKVFLADLIDEPIAVLELVIGSKTYKLYRPDDLPEQYYLRLMKNQVEFSELSDDVNREVEIIKQKLDNFDESTLDADEIRLLQNQRRYQQARLIPPAARTVESMLQMEEYELASLPAAAVEKLYAAVNTALREHTKKDEEPAPAATDAEKKDPSEAALTPT